MADFKSNNPGTWFYFDKGEPKSGGICLRELSIEEHDRIEKLTVKTQKKVRRGVAFDDTKTDEALANKLRWRFCITDWTQVTLDGQTLDCDDDNKDKMMKCTDFVKFVVDSIEILTETNDTIKKASAKNLPISLSGNVISQAAKPV